jgi:serine/threonine-protein kinase
VGPSLFFCYACNERFGAGAGEDPSCPRCGMELQDMSTAPTVRIDVPDGGGESRSAVASSGDDELLGSVLAQYQIEEFLGRGGMARVYRAFHRDLERPCALKILNPSLAEESSDFVGLFLDEARSAASLVHPNVVTVHNVGRDRGLHFIEMEFVEGRALANELLRAGRFAPLEATRLMSQAVSGLSEAHRKGIVHRDLKPGNILLSETGIAKLADFGLAKRVVAPRLAEMELVGTPHFMAPELFAGEAATPESDVYAAGVSFFFLLTGRLPYSAGSMTEVIARHRESPIPDPRAIAPTVPDRARDILETCLAKRRKDRYQNAAGLHEELRKLLGSLRQLEDVVRDALAGLGLEWVGAGRDRFQVEVPLAGGRAHVVFIEKASHGQEELVRVWSPCAPVQDGFLRSALELNARIDHGSISIRDHEGKAHFVMANVYPWPTCDAEEIRESVLSVATWADEVERTLTGEDRY